MHHPSIWRMFHLVLSNSKKQIKAWENMFWFHATNIASNAELSDENGNQFTVIGNEKAIKILYSRNPLEVAVTQSSFDV